jgi:hypothetical protein
LGGSLGWLFGGWGRNPPPEDPIGAIWNDNNPG